MKVCKYCSEVNEDSATRCESCKAAEFINKCNNCDMEFEGGFCPSCGVRAGRRAKVCPDCGMEFYTNACPECGWRPARNVPLQEERDTKVEYVPAESPPQKVEVKLYELRRLGFWRSLLLLSAPYITAWFILFGRFTKGAKNFATGVCLLFGVMILFTVRGLGILIFLPVWAYWGKRAYAQHQEQDPNRKKGRNAQKRILIKSGIIAACFALLLIISFAAPQEVSLDEASSPSAQITPAP